MRWSEIVMGRAGRVVEIGADGIAREAGFSGIESQDAERRWRDRLASPFLETVEDAVREANRYHSRGVMRRRAREVLDELVRSSADSEPLLLDLGSGFGWQWRELARVFAQVRFILVDFVLTNLLVSRRLLPFADYPNVLCLHADIADLPLRDRLADGCWSVQAFQHLPPERRRSGLEEVKRIVKPGGSCHLTWVRSVPAAKFVHRLFGKSYHEQGLAVSGMHFYRFDERIEAEVRQTFRDVRLTYSETLFHPDLHLAGAGPIAAWLDRQLAASPLASVLARQIEIQGTA